MACTAEISEDLLVLRGDRHGVVGVYRVAFKVVGECAEEQLVADAALFYIEVILDLIVAPIRQVLRMVVDLHDRSVTKSLPSFQAYKCNGEPLLISTDELTV